MIFSNVLKFKNFEWNFIFILNGNSTAIIHHRNILFFFFYANCEL